MDLASLAEEPPTPAESSGPSVEAPAQPLSKNAQKRLAKAAWVAEQKKERRAAEKARKKEKKRIQAEKRAAGELDENEEQSRVTKKRRTGEGPKKPFKARVVVDLGFDDKMTENEIKSLTSQLAYTYSANRRAERPFSSLLFTSLNGRTLTRLEAMSNAAYKRWVGAEWWTESYERLWEDLPDGAPNEGETVQTGGTEDAGAQTSTANTQEEPSNEAEPKKTGRKRQPASAARESVIYLTADSSEELTELKEGETYIVGGICDHNRYKNLCLNKSQESHIRSARLPIGTYLSELRTRKVLTVNQTFEILLKWIETGSWEEALWAVIPKRKFQEGRKRGKSASEKDRGEDDEGEDEEGEGHDDDGEDVREHEGEEVVVIDEQMLEEAEGGDRAELNGDARSENTAADETGRSSES